MDNIQRLEQQKFHYCTHCPYLKFSGLKCECAIGHNPKGCPVAESNKKWAEYEQAKADLRAEFEKPFIKIIYWLENKLKRLEKWWRGD